MKDCIFYIVNFIGVGLALYVGVWLMFLKPIIDCCVAFDAGTLTGTMIGCSLAKCILSKFVRIIILKTTLRISTKVLD